MRRKQYCDLLGLSGISIRIKKKTLLSREWGAKDKEIQVSLRQQGCFQFRDDICYSPI